MTLRRIEDVLDDVIRRLDQIEDNDNRYAILPIMEDLWRLKVDLQTAAQIPPLGTVDGPGPRHDRRPRITPKRQPLRARDCALASGPRPRRRACPVVRLGGR
jgi:hypothetical protein